MEWLTFFPVIVLLVVSMSACLTVQTVRRTYAKGNGRTQKDYYYFSAVTSLVAAFAIFALSGFDCKLSIYTLLISIAFGVATLSSTVFSLSALKIGPWAYTTVLTSLSTIIPTLSGAIFWNETIDLLKIIGITLMVASFIFSVFKKNVEKDEKKATLRWFILTLIALVSTGIIGVLQKVHQSSSHKNELAMFLVISFLFSSVFSFALAFLSQKKEMLALQGNTPKTPTNKKLLFKILALFALVGVCSALNNIINLHLSGVMDSAVFFPIVNGGNMLLVTSLAAIIYKEKFSILQWVGIACGIASLLCLCL